MPHFGLMDEKSLGPVDGPLLRARLHLRGGKRRLRQGKISAGIVTLYDALEAAMEAYDALPGHHAALGFGEHERVTSSRVLYVRLVQKGVFDGSFDFDAFDRLIETALHQEIEGYDYRSLLAGIEVLMAQIGVMPFDETRLPPEDPKTF